VLYLSAAKHWLRGGLASGAKSQDQCTGKIRMDHTELSRIVKRIEDKWVNAEIQGYFECLEALDELEFYVLDLIALGYLGSEMEAVKERAVQLHSLLTSIAQAAIDTLIEDIRTRKLASPDLRRLFNQYATSVSNKQRGDVPDYDLFDDFLSHLFQIDYEPSETLNRTEEMVYMQPTPGRIILDMINEMPLTSADRFYDLGSGLGRVPILVSLLTDAHAVGIEYEPTYIHYSRRSAQKLGLMDVEFRNMDARDVDFSDGTVLFMYSPFTGSILRNVLDRLRDLSRERRITLCTYGPCTLVIEQETWLHPIRWTQGEIYRLAIFTSEVGF
jgi:SAM-dependent methyltransferase